MKKIIIIGSSGFIGKSIKDYIKKRINISKVFSYSRSEKKILLQLKNYQQLIILFTALIVKKLKKVRNILTSLSNYW